ncbi:MAG TPA: hypothetical protein VGM54_09510 [Chthoniobacter sp.]|jgi:hypothetical protein
MKIRVKTPLILLTVLLAATAASSQANPHFFPRLRSLFVGLDESRVPAGAKNALQEAKIDFQRARLAEPPHFAAYMGETSDPRGKVYQGQGYQITEVHEEAVNIWYDGPKTTLDKSVTGGRPYQYSEVNREGQS